MMRQPPHILVTTPNPSLYILLTGDGGRRMLATVRTVIVDEIHAVVATKRGAHLALSLERREHLVGRPLTRIGLSATQRPKQSRNFWWELQAIAPSSITVTDRFSTWPSNSHHRRWKPCCPSRRWGRSMTGWPH